MTPYDRAAKILAELAELPERERREVVRLLVSTLEKSLDSPEIPAYNR